MPRRYLLPFQACVEKGGVSGLMCRCVTVITGAIVTAGHCGVKSVIQVC
jgi:hypothetical protein